MKFAHQDVHDFEGVTRNFEQIQEAGMFAGSGAPTFPANKGNYFFRTDTPTVANQRIYIYTGTVWTGIV